MYFILVQQKNFLPIFNKKKFNVGKNIFLGYSPEREDQGNYKYTILKKNLSKLSQVIQMIVEK